MVRVFRARLLAEFKAAGLVQHRDKIVDRFAITIYPCSLCGMCSVAKVVFHHATSHALTMLPVIPDHLRFVCEEDHLQAYTKAIDFLHRYVLVALRALDDLDCLQK